MKKNADAILTSERLKNLDTLAETLNDLKINNTGYYNSDKNDGEGDPKSDPKVATHTSDRKKRKVTETDTNNRNYPQKILINRTLLMITTPIDLWIMDGVGTCRGTTHARQMPTSKVVITDTACISAHIFWTPGDISRTFRDITTP